MKNFQFNIESQTSRGWLDRAERCAQLIFSLEDSLTGSPLLADMGCGDEKLKKILTSGPINFLYQGYDINPQSPSVIKFDVNSDELEVTYDVIATLGLTEYIGLSKFLSSMRKRCRFFVVSHVLKNPNHYNENDLKRLGWINHLSAEDFEASLALAGFNIIRTSMTEDHKVKIWLCN